MKHIHYLDEEAVEVSEDGAYGIKLRTVIGEKDGADNFFMRIISFDANASSPAHSHPWEHETFVLRGKGILEVEGEEVPLKAGDITFIPGNAEHTFRTSKEPMEMICLIPKT